MKKKRGRKKRAHEYLSNGLVVHGAFKTKAAAEAKERKLGRHAFIVKKFARWGRGPMSTRYCVFTKDEATGFDF